MVELASYECNKCGNRQMYGSTTRCDRCGETMTIQPSVDEILLMMRNRRMIANSPYPVAESGALRISREVMR